MPKWLLLLLLMLAVPVQAAAPMTEAIVGRPVPPRLSQDFLRFCAEVEYYATNVVAPMNRATTYYFSTSGNDANSGLTTGLPKQNISALNTLIGASGGNIAILLKCGDVWDVTVGINGDATDDNITIASYGTGARPLLNGFTSKIASGSAWTVATGSRYTATAAADMGDFREVNRRDFMYRRVASTAEVESTPFSYYWAAGTVHCNAGGVDPDTVTGGYEYTLAATTDDSGIEIPAGATGYRIDGIQCDGWGADGGATNQEYGIKFSGNGSDKCVITNCKATRSARHNIGHNGGANSGGWIYVANCEAGMDTEVGAAPYVFYQQNGAQEVWLFGNSTPWGAQPLTATRTWADGMPVIAHTNSTSTPPGFVCVLDHRIPANAQGFGCHQGIVLDNFAYQADPNLCDAVVIGTRMDKSYGTGSNGTSGATPAMQGTVEINGYYQFTNLNTPYESMGSFNPRGFVYNTFYQFDFTSPAFTNAFFALYNPAASVSDPKFRHCFFEIISNGTGDFGLNYDTNFAAAAQATVDFTTGSELSSSVWSVIRKFPTSTADVIRPALANSSSCLKANAYWNVSADGTYVGVSNTVSPVTLTHAPIFGTIPAQGSPLVLAGRGGYIPYDFSRLARNVTQPTIGPIEMPTETLITPTAAEMAQQIWAIDTTQITTAGSIGERAKRLPNVDPGAANGLFIAGTNATTTVNITGNVTGNLTGSVGSIGTDGITASSIQADAIGAAEIATDAIGAAEIATDAIGNAEIASAAIGNSEIATDAIAASEIADNAIDAATIQANAIGASQVASDAIVEIQSGLALETSVDNVPTVAELNARTLLTASYATAGQINDIETELLNVPTNAEFAAGLDALPTAAENADAVLDEPMAGHSTIGTFGATASNTLTAANAAQSAAEDAVTNIDALPTAIENATQLLNTTLSDTGANKAGRALYYLVQAFESPGVFTEAALAGNAFPLSGTGLSNFNTFFNNGNAASTKTINNVTAPKNVTINVPQ